MRQPYLSVFEKGFFFEDEEAELAAFTGTGAGLFEGAVRGLLAAAAALFIERLIAAIAAAPAAEVCWVTLFTVEGFTLAPVQSWSVGKRCCGQNCCLHDYRRMNQSCIE